MGALDERNRTVGNRVRREFRANDVKVTHRIAGRFEGCAVNHVNEDAASFDVSKEVKPETLALGGARDESGDVGNRVAILFDVNNPEVGVQRCERVIRDFRLRRRNRGDERRFSRGRVSNEGDVGDGLEFENDIAVPPERAEECEPGSLAFERSEGRIAEPALTTGGDHVFHVRLVEVNENLTIDVLDHRSDGDGERQRFTLVPASVITHSEPAVFTRTMWSIVEVEKSRDLGV